MQRPAWMIPSIAVLVMGASWARPRVRRPTIRITPSACRPMASMETQSPAGIRPWLHARCRPRAVPRNASRTPITGRRVRGADTAPIDPAEEVNASIA